MRSILRWVAISFKNPETRPRSLGGPSLDRAVGAMTSLLEPILIVLLAIVVGSIVIALFLPISNFYT